jgi:hypothetical protein
MSVNSRSSQAKLDEQGFESVKSDIQTLCRAVGTASVITSAQASVLAGAAGVARVYGTSRVTTTGSSGANYHLVTVKRNNTDGPEGLGIDTRATEATGYTVQYFGSFPVAFGDRLDISIATTGAPTALVAADWTIIATVTDS